MSLQRIQKISVTDQVLFQLEREILLGSWKSGEQIPSEITIAQELQVSRSCVTAALDRLRERHVLRSVPGKGTYLNDRQQLASSPIAGLVTGDSQELLRYVTEFLQILLAPVAQTAVEKATPECIARLDRIMRRLSSSLDAPETFTQYDSQFYMEILRCTGNPLLIRMYENNEDLFTQSLSRLEMLTTPSERLDAHARLIQCFRDKDALRARILVNREYHRFLILLSGNHYD